MVRDAKELERDEDGDEDIQLARVFILLFIPVLSVGFIPLEDVAVEGTL